MEQHRAPKINYRVRNIRKEGNKWIADVTTWEGCCSNLQINEVCLEQTKRPSAKDFIKAHQYTTI